MRMPREGREHSSGGNDVWGHSCCQEDWVLILDEKRWSTADPGIAVDDGKGELSVIKGRNDGKDRN